MAHHFDTEASRRDPQLNVCDIYLFAGRPGFTTMVMTSNGDVGFSAPDTYHPEGIYAFRFDRTGDHIEDLTFKVRFGEPMHVHGDEHRHSQGFEVFKAEGDDIAGLGGQRIFSGKTNETGAHGGVTAFAGVVPELWAADALGFRAIVAALRDEDRFDKNGFVNGRNWFENRNVMAIVLEVPDAMIGSDKVGFWATISLFGHAPEAQICRFGYPLFTFLLLAERPDLFDAYHSSQPKDDAIRFGPTVRAVAAHLARTVSGAGDAVQHQQTVAARFLPSLLPYTLGEKATFTVEQINGRPLHDHALKVMWSITAGGFITDGNTPPTEKIRAEFPYYGAPFNPEEQAGFTPLTGVAAN